MKYECNLVKDLLPLYHDEVCSRESKNAVEAHLQECEDCREYYNAINTSDVVEDVTYDEEREREKNKMLKKLKSGFLITGIKKILFVLRWLTLIAYVVFVGFCIYLAFMWIDNWLYPQLHVEMLLMVGVMWVLIPVTALLFLFYKSKKAWQYILQAVVQFIVLWLSPAMVLVSLLVLPGGIWHSATTELENYHVYEEEVEDHLDSPDLDIIPSALPENIEEVSYSYLYYIAIDSVVTIDASWQYLDEASYEQEKERVLQKGVAETYEENGYTVCRKKVYANGSSAEFGYNDETKAVFYRINGIW